MEEMEEIIVQIKMTNNGENTVFNFDNLAKTEEGKTAASTFIKMIAKEINPDVLEYAKMKTDEGEVILK